MKEVIITKDISNQRLDKMLKKYLPQAGNAFIYKMLRKKNITLNNKKAEGNEILCEGDVIKIFFSDETFDKFSASDADTFAYLKGIKDSLDIVYEDDKKIIINKPAGILSQKADKNDISINEIALKHMLDKKELTEESLKKYHPSVVNRLDMYTTGLILFAKTYEAARELSDSISNRECEKYYYTVVKGHFDGEICLEGYLSKDERSNIVSISKEEKEGYSYCKTGVVPKKYYKDYSLLEIRLYTGRSHQIRAFLAYAGYPILGDPKYGDKTLNSYLKATYGIKSQLLHAYRIVLNDKTEYVARLPKTFSNILGDIDFGNL